MWIITWEAYFFVEMGSVQTDLASTAVYCEIGGGIWFHPLESLRKAHLIGEPML